MEKEFKGGIDSKKFSKPKTTVKSHRLKGIYIIRSFQDDLATKNLTPGELVYDEKCVTIEETTQMPNGEGDIVNKVEYRVWNAFRSKLAAAIFNGIENIYMKPGAKVLYLGVCNGTTISHISDIVGEKGIVYGVEISERSGRDLINMAKKRPNLVPIIDDVRKPQNYRFLIPTKVDVILANITQPDQARIIAINAEHFLKNEGGFVFSIKANCVDSTTKLENVFYEQIKILKSYKLIAKELARLEPYERDHAVITGLYKPFKEKEEN